MKCRNHPDREVIATCQKYETGFCGECCECFNLDACCECMDPRDYCKFRHHCLIWEMSRDRRKEKVNGGDGVMERQENRKARNSGT